MNVIKKYLAEVGFEPTPTFVDQNTHILNRESRVIPLESGALDRSAILTYIHFGLSLNILFGQIGLTFLGTRTFCIKRKLFEKELSWLFHDENRKKKKTNMWFKKIKELCFMLLAIFHMNCILLLMVKTNLTQF